MSSFVFLAFLKVRTRTYNKHLSMPSPPWQNSVGSNIILYSVRADDPADDIRSKMVEIDVVARLVGLLQDRHSYGHQSSIKVITTLAKFGRLINRFEPCDD